MSRGLLIVVEGCDRSGKSTQCARLTDRLNANGHNTKLLKFPDRTTQTGRMIDGYLKQSSHMNDQAIHLLFSANRWEAMDAMEQMLKSGTHLVVDRYAFSGVAFSSAKGLDLEWCKHPDVGLLVPDLVLFLDLSIDEAEKRGGFGVERYETRELQTKVRGKFMALKDPSWKIIDAKGSMDQVHDTMWNIINQAVETPVETDLAFALWK